MTSSARTASTTCGRQLAALALEFLADSDPHSPAVQLARAYRAREADGNLAVMQGALSKELGVTPLAAVLIELRGAAVPFLTAAVRLGRLSPTKAQVIAYRLTPAIGDAAAAALAAEELHSTQTRFFAT
ncbi:urease accessory UreF family protein [Streptomyces sp. NPDC102278]|uniref:urease accessory UreF family protein n=1 Tax=Streptomyces sp. NPDC102278 TaxID=3366152 RepID=UPI0038174A0A